MATICGAVLAALLACGPSGPGGGPPELGAVRWGDDLDAAFAAARQSGRPVLVLFQEIPGCDTCVRFGGGPLSHPLLVEAMEDLFVPVAVHNNRPGRDAEICRRFDEPAWNNPVLRFLDASGADLLPRRDRVWSTGAVAARLTAALEAAARPVPAYLALAAAETSDAPRATATFAMHCFWEGEARLGALDGVLATRAGWHDGLEVVEVAYDPARLPYDRLVRGAMASQCAARVYAHTDEQLAAARRIDGASVEPIAAPARDAEPSDRKFALERSPFAVLPLTPMQATKANAAVRLGEDPRRWLSPRQLALLARLRAALDEDPDRLDGLARPDAIDELPAYERALRARLGP